MNDEFKGKSGKVKVMYVRGDDDSEKRSQNPRTGKGGGRTAAPSRGEGRRGPRRDDKPGALRDWFFSGVRDDRGDNPWRTVSRPPREEVVEAGEQMCANGRPIFDL